MIIPASNNAQVRCNLMEGGISICEKQRGQISRPLRSDSGLIKLYWQE